ncbi:MAG: hypothetical protein ACTSYZ_13985 [Candidatus Helarchaeota archaeon]
MDEFNLTIIKIRILRIIWKLLILDRILGISKYFGLRNIINNYYDAQTIFN